MSNPRLLGIALLAAYMAFCFTRDPAPRASVPTRTRGGRRGDRDTLEPPRRIPPPHVHEGDPSVRH